MTNKAKTILQKMNKRKALKRLNTPGSRDRILSEFNRSTMDDVGPWGADECMALLKDMNGLEAGHDEFVKGLAPSVAVR